MLVDILGTSWDQCQSMVQYSFMSMETRRLVKTDSPGRPPNSHTAPELCIRRWGKREIIYLSLHCHHQNDTCIKVGSDVSHFNVSVGSDGQSHKVSTNHNLFEEKVEPKAVSNCGPSAYQPDALPLGQTSSRLHWVLLSVFIQKKTFFFLLWHWAPRGTIMMACSLPMKSGERLTCDVLDTFAKRSCHVHDLSDADCWAQNGSTHSSVFTTSKHQVSNRYQVKNCCAQNSSTPRSVYATFKKKIF